MCASTYINLVWHLWSWKQRETYCNNFLLRSERSAEFGAGALFAQQQQQHKICARLSKVLLFSFKIKFLLSLARSSFAWIEMDRNFFPFFSLSLYIIHPQYIRLCRRVSRAPRISFYFLILLGLWMKKLDFLNKRIIKKTWWWWRYADMFNFTIDSDCKLAECNYFQLMMC